MIYSHLNFVIFSSFKLTLKFRRMQSYTPTKQFNLNYFKHQSKFKLTKKKDKLEHFTIGRISTFDVVTQSHDKNFI